MVSESRWGKGHRCVHPCPLLTAFSSSVITATQSLKFCISTLGAYCLYCLCRLSSRSCPHDTHMPLLSALLSLKSWHQCSVTRTKGLLHFLYLRRGRGFCTAEASNHSAPLHSGASIKQIEIWGNPQFRKPVSQVLAHIYNIPCLTRLGFSGLSWPTAVGNWHTISIFGRENARIYKTHANRRQKSQLRVS